MNYYADYPLINEPGIVITDDASKLSSGQIAAIVISVLVVVIGIFLGVWFGVSCQNKKRREHNMSVKNRHHGSHNSSYERQMPRQMTPEEIVIMRIGTTGGPDNIPGPMPKPGPASGSTLAMTNNSGDAPNPIVTAQQALDMINSGQKFSLVLFSRRCPACVRLLKNVTEWAKAGSLGDAKVVLMESSEWQKAPEGVLKDALKTDAIPLTATFNKGVAGEKKLGAVSLDVFKQLIDQ